MKKNSLKIYSRQSLVCFQFLKKYFSVLHFSVWIPFTFLYPFRYLCFLLTIVYSFSSFLSLSSSYLPTFLSVKNMYVLFARHYARVSGTEGIDVKAMVSVQFAHKNLKIILHILCDSARNFGHSGNFPPVCVVEI